MEKLQGSRKEFRGVLGLACASDVSGATDGVKDTSDRRYGTGLSRGIPA